MEPYGYRVLCAYMHPPRSEGYGLLSRRATAEGVSLLSIVDRGPWDGYVVKQLLDVCRRHRVAIWHAHDYKATVIGWLLRHLWPMKLVSTVQGWVEISTKLSAYYRIEQHCLRTYDRILCVSEDLRDACVKSGVPADRCIVVENAVDTSVHSRQVSIEQAKRMLGFHESRSLVVGCLARLSPEKNLKTLIKVVDRLISDGLSLELFIAGEGPERQELAAYIAALERQDRIHLLGHRLDTVNLLQAMDVFILSSLREGLPLALLEAMSLGVPVIAPRIAGISKLIVDGYNGLLVESASEERLTAALVRMFTDVDLRRRLADAGRQTISTHYNLETSMRRIRGVYEEVLTAETGRKATSWLFA
jgi:glycosyltransferase involved in cell wall biosynthesis